MYNSRGYDDRRRGPYNEPNRGRGESNEYGRRDDYGGSSGMKRGSYSDHRGVDSGMFSSSAPKRSRDLDSMSGGGGYLDRSRGSGGGILDTPRLDRSLLLAEEERLRQLEEIAQLKREHELALLRRTFDLNRREVQAALSSRDGGIRGGPGGYGRDRQMDYDRRGIHDRDTRRDRLRRDAPRGPRQRSPPPPRRRSPIQNRLGARSRSPPRGNRSHDRYSRDRNRAAETPSRNQRRCEICSIDFKSSEERVEHEEKDEKHISVIKQFQNFSEKSGKTMEELIKQYLDSRSKPEPGEVPPETETKDKASTSKKKEDPEAEKYPGLFYTGERWRVRVYNPDLTLGPDFIVPATGWYCVLCQKFYYSEEPAKSSHCQTKVHWENLRSWLKINGHRYEPYQYDKFVESEEKAKEELKKKRSTGGSNENDSTTNQKGESDSFRQSEKSKSVTAVTDNSVGEEQPQQSEIELDEGEIKSTGLSDIGPLQSASKHVQQPHNELQLSTSNDEDMIETDDVALDYECEDEYIQEDDIQMHEGGQIDDIDVEEGEMRSGRESVNNNPETVAEEESQSSKSSPRRLIHEEREKGESNKYRGDSSSGGDRCAIRKVNTSSAAKTSTGDAEMYSMFDNIEAILNSNGGLNDSKDDNHDEIPVSVVDDPFGAEGNEYSTELTYEEDQEDLNDPPTEEISGEHGAFEFVQTPMDENEGVPPSSEIEEDTNFTVHEEEEDEEERIEEEAEDGEETNHAQSAERGLNGSTEESTHQLSIREEPVEARYRRVSPQKRVATGAANATLQTAKRGGASRGRARGRARNR